jgi:hypothetical protein
MPVSASIEGMSQRTGIAPGAASATFPAPDDSTPRSVYDCGLKYSTMNAPVAASRKPR